MSSFLYTIRIYKFNVDSITATKAFTCVYRLGACQVLFSTSEFITLYLMYISATKAFSSPEAWRMPSFLYVFFVFEYIQVDMLYFT